MLEPSAYAPLIPCAATFIETLTAWATLATAAGTLLLAAGTFYMASKTRDEATATRDTVEVSKEQVDAALRQVELSRRQAEAAELAVNAQVRPVLIDVPRGEFKEPVLVGADGRVSAYRDAGEVDVSLHHEDEVLVISVPFRNVGSGLARITGVGLRAGFPLAFFPTILNANIPPGERTRFSFTVRPENDGHRDMWGLVEEQNGFDVEVSYTDVAGGQAALTRANVMWSEGLRGYRVRQIFTSDAFTGGEGVGSAPIQD